MKVENEGAFRKWIRRRARRHAPGALPPAPASGKSQRSKAGSRARCILLAAALVLAGAGLFFGLPPYRRPSPEIQLRIARPLFPCATAGFAAPDDDDGSDGRAVSDSAGPGEVPADRAASDPGPPPSAVALGKRTLVELLSGQEIAPGDIGPIVAALRRHLNLRRLQPQDTLQVHRAADGAVTQVVYRRSPVEIFEVRRGESGWAASRRDVAVDRRIARVSGTLEDNLFDSLASLGESPRLVMDFAAIFAWVFDFAADSQPGDRFRMLVEKLYLKDRLVDYGRILAAEYESEGTLYTAVYFEDKDKGDYYTPEGESLRRAFLKSPVDFTRISSGYNRARRHPILGGVRPHLAVDYAAPVGTPVWAVADGVVKFAGRRGGLGKTVTLRHRSGYQTVYSHLSRFGRGIHGGARVRQRQVIGYVGSTGMSTGPHLDYRVIKDGRNVNPMKQKFLPGDPISASSRPAFVAARDAYLQRLRRGPQPGAPAE